MSSTPLFVPFGGWQVQAQSPDLAAVVVLPVPYESGPSFGGGSHRGPLYILNASTQLEDTDEVSGFAWADAGVYTEDPLFVGSDPKTAIPAIAEAAGAVLDRGKPFLALGGDHAITIGLVQAAARRFPGLGVLQVDAHLDLRDRWNGSTYNHGCVMRRLAGDLGLPAVQVGIRAFASDERPVLKNLGLSPFWAHEIRPGDDSWIHEAVGRLPETVYLTLDVDGLDPSVIPGTGTPEPGGLSFRQVSELIRVLGQKRRLVAADITELAPIPGSSLSEYTAAKLARNILVHGFFLGNRPTA
ncbi:MAG: agmatinase [Proteobacteria bacterium]|nr:agmatinase [Pseudomonadota bacterium]